MKLIFILFQSDRKEQVIRCVIVGDGGVGKSLIVHTYSGSTDKSPGHYYMPGPIDVPPVTLTVNDKPKTITLVDTYGQEDYDRYRPLFYPDTDVFLICFSLVSPATLENVEGKWYTEVRHHCPNTPVILVGNNLDSREDPHVVKDLKNKNLSPVSYSVGLAMANKIGAVKYCECSALTKEGLDAVFENAVLTFLEFEKSKKKKKKWKFRS